jgi:catechol 2,3-dioxygenase-like lactoylglutathione lyase family enzyme
MSDFVLDHVGIAVNDLDAAAATYRRLGFTLSDLSHHMDAGPPPKRRGTGNHCIMLGQGYVELIGVTDAAYQGRLRQHLQRYQGLHIVAFGTRNIAVAVAELTARGVAPSAVRRMTRPIVERGRTMVADFSIVDLPAPVGEGYYIGIEHHTPQALWQPHLLAHANGAQGLTGVTICVDQPTQFAHGMAATLGGACASTEAGLVVTLDRTQVTVIDPAGLSRCYPGVVAPALPFVAGIALSVDDLDRARRALAAAGALCHDRSAHDHKTGAIWIAPADACGAAIEFVQE